MGLAIFLLVLSYGISFYNSWAVGQVWLEAKEAGGPILAYAWCGRIMAICGYTQMHVVVLGFAAYLLGKISIDTLNAVFGLGYLLIVFPIIGIGIIMTMQAWAAWWRHRTFGNLGVAAYDSAATIYNIRNAFDGVPWALKALDKVLNSKGKKDQTAWLLAIVVTAVVGGIIIDHKVVKASAESAGQKRENELYRAHEKALARSDY